MIPIFTTTVTVRRPIDGDGDPYEPDAPGVVATGVRAHISGPLGASGRLGGAQEVVDATLYVGIGVPLTHLDTIEDEATGDCYRLTWVRRRRGLGMDHQQAGLVAVVGASNG